METQVRIKRIVSWTIPYFGNNHIFPYGKLEVTDGKTTKIVKTKGDTLETYPIHVCQYITFNRKAYRVVTFYDGLTRTQKMRLEPIKKNKNGE